MRDRVRRLAIGGVVVVGTVIVSGGPLLRLRTWWGFTDPLEGDAVVIAARASVGAAGVAALWRSGRWRQLAGPATLCWFTLVAWLTVSAAWSVRPVVTFREAALVGAALVAGLAASVTMSPRLLRWSTWTGLHIGLAWSAFATLLLRPGTQDELGYWTGVFFNRNSLALTAAAGIWASLWVGAEAGRDLTKRSVRSVVRAGMALALIADAVLIARSRSLTPVLALVAMVLVVMVVAVGGRMVVERGGRLRTALAAGALVIATLVSVGWLAREHLARAVGRDADLSGRAEVWRVAWDWFARRPIVGHGYLGPGATSEFQFDVYQAQGMVLTSAHSTLMDVLMGGGLIGATLLAGAVVALCVVAARPAVMTGGTASWWPLAIVAFIITEHAVETLLVGGHLTVALVGVALALSARLGALPP